MFFLTELASLWSTVAHFCQTTPSLHPLQTGSLPAIWLLSPLNIVFCPMQLHFHFSLSCIGKGSGNPLQCSCLENPGDGGAWWAAVYGVAQSRTRLKQLSSSSSSPTWSFASMCPSISTLIVMWGGIPSQSCRWLYFTVITWQIKYANSFVPWTK